MTTTPGKTYEIGMNMAGETAGQVANYLTADLRVALKSQQGFIDSVQLGIANAIREAAIAAARRLEETEREVAEQKEGWAAADAACDNLTMRCTKYIADIAALTASRDELRGQVEAVRKALADVMKFAKPSRGRFCSAECLGTCDECKAVRAAYAIRKADAALGGGKPTDANDVARGAVGNSL